MNHGVNQDSIQEMNRTLLINLLRKEKECNRVHLSNLTKLKQATVTNIINDFISWGLVKETGFLTGSKGRRSIGISINNDAFSVLAIRLARKNYSIGLFDLSGNSDISKKVDISVKSTPSEVFKSIIQDAKQMMESNRNRQIIAIGMAIPGPYSIKRGRIELMTEVSGWNEISIREELFEAFHLPVFIEQDANAGALAQLWHTEADYSKNVLVYIAAGQGVGAGVLVNGEILKGSIGIAGEIGHTTIDMNGPLCACGNRGCLEKYCSSIAITRAINQVRRPKVDYTFSQVTEMIKSGDKVCMEEFEKSCDYLAIGIINVINSFNPGVIIIGDEMAHILPEVMLERVRRIVKERVLPEIYTNIEIIMSVVKNNSVLHGAAIIAINDIFHNPEKYFNVNN